MTNSAPLRVWILLAIISLFLMILGYTLGERQGLLVGFLVSASCVGLSYYYSDHYWVDTFQAEPLEGQDAWGLIEKTQKIASLARIPPPQLFLSDQEFPTALSIGRTVESSKIILTRGLLKSISTEDMDLLLARQVMSIRFGLPYALGTLTGLLAPLFLMARMTDRLLSILRRGEKSWVGFFVPITSLLLKSFLGLITSPRIELTVDLAAGDLLRGEEKLARILIALKDYSVTRRLDIPRSAAHMLVVNPLTIRDRARYFEIQPPVPIRVKNLVGRFPI